MKKAFLVLMMIAVCGNAFGQIEAIEKEPIVIEKPVVEPTQDYWVYVRLEDRSGLTSLADAGRSKAGDVVAVLPVTPQHIPSETEKKEWMIYKTSLTETQRQEMIEPLEEVVVREDGSRDVIPIAYRKNKLDTSKLGVVVKTGLIAETIDATKIETSVKTTQDLVRYETQRKFYAYVQRPIIRLANLFSGKKAYAANISTCNTTGEDYNTLTLWEDATDNDLAAAEVGETVHVYDDDGILYEALSIGGATTTATYFRTVEVPSGESHGGDVSAGATLHYVSTANDKQALSFGENYSVVRGLNIILDYNNVSYTYNRIVRMQYYTKEILANCIVQSINRATASNLDRGILIEGRSGYGAIVHYITNNIIISRATQGIYIDDVSSGDLTAHVYNNTIYGCAYQGIYASNEAANTSIIKNNISVNNGGVAFTFSNYITHDYNCSSDATATGDNSLTTCSADDFEDVTSGEEILRIVSDAVVINEGVDLGTTYGAEIDILGRNRDTQGDVWDIGVHEYVAAVTARRRMMIIQ